MHESGQAVAPRQGYTQTLHRWDISPLCRGIMVYSVKGTGLNSRGRAHASTGVFQAMIRI